MEHLSDIIKLAAVLVITAAIISVIIITTKNGGIVHANFQKESGYYDKTIVQHPLETFVNTECTGADVMYALDTITSHVNNESDAVKNGDPVITVDTFISGPLSTTNKFFNVNTVDTNYPNIQRYWKFSCVRYKYKEDTDVFYGISFKRIE